MSELIPQDIFDQLPEQFRIRARQIKARVAEIDRLLLPCQVSDIRDAAVRLRGQLRPQPDTVVATFAEEFKLACADIPAWAISEAVNDFLGGRVEGHTGQFMPTCAEFARHARSIIAPFAGERVIIRREAKQLFNRAEDERRRQIIALERQDPNQRQRVRAMIDAALKGAPKAIRSNPHTTIDEDMQARLDALKLPRSEHVSKIPQTKAGRLK